MGKKGQYWSAHTRQFGGEPYNRHEIYSSKRDAENKAAQYRGKGFKARITQSEKYGYVVWVRR